MPINITYNNDKIYNSIKIQNTDTGSYYKYVNLQDLYFNSNVQYEISYTVFTEATSSYPFDLYITSSNGDAFIKTNKNGYLVDVVNTKLNSVTSKQNIITPIYNGTGSIGLLFKYGTYYISDFKVKPYHSNNFSLGEMDLIIPTPPTQRGEPLSIYPTYISRNGKPVGNVNVTLADAGQSTDFARYTLVTGSNLVISLDDNLIEGSLFVGKNLRTGVEISGQNNAMIRSVGYSGFNNARINPNLSGFLLYSGSVLPGSGDYYRGIGLELHAGGNSGSLRYRVDDSGSFLEISGSIYATNGFFSGIISASAGYIANWQITTNDLRSATPYGGIKLISTGVGGVGGNSAIQFYSGSNTLVSIESDATTIDVYGIGPQTLYAAHYNIGNQDINNTQGASLIFNFDYGLPTVSHGDFVVLNTRNIVLDATASIQLNGPTYCYNLMHIDGSAVSGSKGRFTNIWKSPKAPYITLTASAFTSNNTSEITSYNGDPWTDGVRSNTAIFGTNHNTMGSVYSPRFETGIITSSISDIINAGIVGMNDRKFGLLGANGLRVGSYAWANGTNTTEISSSTSTALLVDGAPGTDAKSGVFRWGRFYIGDPWNVYSGSNKIVFFADASPEFNGTPNPSFQRIGINTCKPQYELHVVGNIYATGDITAFSDIRKKKNIIEISSSLELIKQLRGVRFEFISGSESPNKDLINDKNENKIHVGLIAQEVEKILPEVVVTADDGYKSINYGSIVSVLINAMKEQQSQIDQLKDEIKLLRR